MSAAEHLQAQQQAQDLPQTQKSTPLSHTPENIASTSGTSSPNEVRSQNGFTDDAMDEEVPESPPDDEQYTFGLEDFEMSVPENNNLMMERSPSPLPPPLPMPENHLSSANSSFPFATTQAAPLQPFYQQQNTFQNLNQPAVLNPAMLHVQSGSSTTISPSQLNQSPTVFINPSQATLQRQPRPTGSIEVIVPSNSLSRRERSPLAGIISPAKRQKTVPIEESPLPTISPRSSYSPQSVLKPSPAMRPLSESEQVWQRIEADVARNLNLANKAPIGTVQKLFKLLSLYVTEPPNAAKMNTREATITELSVPPHGRIMMLTALKEKTSEQFDGCLVTDPRATVLLAEWAKDLAVYAKGKGKVQGDEEALVVTARPLMEVSYFCPSILFFFSRFATPTLLDFAILCLFLGFQRSFRRILPISACCLDTGCGKANKKN